MKIIKLTAVISLIFDFTSEIEDFSSLRLEEDLVVDALAEVLFKSVRFDEETE